MSHTTTMSKKEKDLQSLEAARQEVLKNRDKYKVGHWDQLEEDLAISAVRAAAKEKEVMKTK